ncbi:MAG: isochorismate synthase [Winkia neuii]|uniref:isochorismate synthase n=1 Tax=Winkia neuii TaxID=33007 RepID=UPI00040C32F2|nr:isochorismate synthase [Winkia neuii]MDK8099349.1 isochorismate synthase [Winkia neuii]MDU3134461.1 isochorismate synthase [Winkia neuii]OFJ70859.1 hypothetical protein HMPREF2851_09710 [Actinomyces sp. HMSC064C12]
MAPLSLPGSKLNVQRLANPLPIVPELFGFIPTSSLSAWVSSDLALIGWGKRRMHREPGTTAITDADCRWNNFSPKLPQEKSLPFELPIAFGSFGFASGGLLEIPANLLVATRQDTWLISYEGEDLRPLFPSPSKLRQLGSKRLAALPPLGKGAERPGALTGAEWAEAVANVAARLRQGEAKKVVLARNKRITTATPIDQRGLCAALFAAYPTCWIYAVQGLVGATPELLASTSNGNLFCRVLAGTAGPDEGAKLLASAKDQREHEIAVASVREALSPLTTELQIPAAPALLRLPNVCHLATDVHAKTNSSALAAAGALHPTAAVCGTPTDVARKILAAAEQMNRGRYAGPVGWVDKAGNGEFGIALRGGQILEGARQIDIYAGAGIMPESDPQTELAETEAKMQPMVAALDSLS